MPNPRELGEADMQDMLLPRRYWVTDPSLFPDGAVETTSGVNNLNRGRSAKAVLESYISKLEMARLNGLNLWLAGRNGVGKTAAAAHLLKLFRSHGQTCHYVHAETYRSINFRDREIPDQGLLSAICMTSDVLMIDEVGKEAPDNSGFFASRLEYLLRERYANGAVTIVTANFGVHRICEVYPDKMSLAHLLSQSYGQVACNGRDLRESIDRVGFDTI